jgi:3-phosphoshikimate 1-carboxyvinyltransferase
MIEIQSRPVRNTTVAVPGSKSYTHRALIVSALSDGECEIRNGLDSEDTRLTRDALHQMGILIDQGPASWRVRGGYGILQPCANPIFLGNSGTSMRLLAAVCALGKGKYILTGTRRMQERPILDLLEGLHQLGVRTVSLSSPGCPPIEIEAGVISGGTVSLNCGTSSQYLSALLLISPFTQKGMEIRVTEGPVSKPYIDMTIDIMNQAGVSVSRNGYERFQIAGNQRYLPRRFCVEPDISQAGYFWAAAAVTGATISVAGVSHGSRQGDLRLLDVLSSMGCTTRVEQNGVSVTGGELRAVEVDMSAMPDMVPTLAVVAAFAKGKTVVTNVGHLKAKESDRLGSVVAELQKLGISAGCSDTAMWIEGGTPNAALIDPHNDHRLAMSFAVAGLKTPGIRIENETCVEKSFPEFWKVFESLYS